MAETDDLADIAKVQEFMKQQVDAYVAEKYPQLNDSQQQSQQGQRSQPTDQDVARNQLRDIITPFVKPDLDAVNLTAQDTKDYVRFYGSTPEAMEYQEQVEKTFDALAKAGRPIPRADIYNHLLGTEYRADPDAFTAKQTERRKQAVQRAEVAMDFGAGALTKAKADPQFANFASLSLEDMEKALDGVTF